MRGRKIRKEDSIKYNQSIGGMTEQIDSRQIAGWMMDVQKPKKKKGYWWFYDEVQG